MEDYAEIFYHCIDLALIGCIVRGNRLKIVLVCIYAGSATSFRCGELFLTACYGLISDDQPLSIRSAVLIGSFGHAGVPLSFAGHHEKHSKFFNYCSYRPWEINSSRLFHPALWRAGNA